MPKFLALAAFFAALLFVSPASAQVSVTIDDSIEWDNVVGAASYEVLMTDTLGAAIAPSNPAADDPDGDNDVEVPSDPDGVSQVALNKWLAGRALGTYKIRVRSVDSNGNAGLWSADLVITYDAPGPPTPRKS